MGRSLSVTVGSPPGSRSRITLDPLWIADTLAGILTSERPIVDPAGISDAVDAQLSYPGSALLPATLPFTIG